MRHIVVRIAKLHSYLSAQYLHDVHVNFDSTSIYMTSLFL